MFTDYSESDSDPVLLQSTKNRLRGTFRLSNTGVTIANTIRRAILTQTPSVGFRTEPYEKSEVQISINTTPLVNEMVAHRIGMIPIHADPKTFDPELFTFELDVENSSKQIRDVRAKDFRVTMRDPKNPLEKPIEVDPLTFFPPDPITGDTILITRLRPQWNPTAPNERIQLKARASVSNGTENIRWSPVSQASYEYTRDTDPEHVKRVFSKWLETHKKIADLEGVEGTKREELEAEFNTMEIQRCYLTDTFGNPNDFTFHVESVGVQNVPQIVRTALITCDLLVSKYQDIDGKIPDNVVVQEGDSRFPSIDFIFTNESHTLGNLLVDWLVDNAIGTDTAITYAGYKVPHPLRPEMFVRVGVKEELDVDLRKSTARTKIAEACRALRDQFRELRASWEALTGSGVAAAAAAAGGAGTE